jgi:hypothetical protein
VLSNSTAIRVNAAKKSSLPSGSLLSPLDTQLTTEESVLPKTYSADGSGTSKSLEMDVEHYGRNGTLYKAFLFYVSGRDQIYDYGQFTGTTHFTAENILDYNYFLFPRLRRAGFGGRVEHQLNSRLYIAGTATLSSTHATAEDFDEDTRTNVSLPFSGDEAPYHPKVNATGSIQYIDEGGDKAQIRMTYLGPFYTDTHNLAVAGSRPRDSGTITLDLLLFKEIGKKQEYYIKVFNLLDSDQFIYNDIPYNQRQIQLGVQWRW